jgi:phospholipid/cholesterol/gamma-HCH transport system ATP-binding protein
LGTGNFEPVGITLNQIGKRFEDESFEHPEAPWLFRNINLHIPQGSTASLVGPSGSGKSVLLKMIAGLIPPSEGTVKIDRTQLGMLFQKNALFDSFTVLENLLFPLKERQGLIGKAAKEKAEWFLKEVGLQGNEELYPDEISGGMQKRLGIARALIIDPQIVLYDDPTAGLDPITSRKIADLIRSLRERSQATLLTVTNDMQRAYQLGEKIYILAQGHLLGGDNPERTQNTQNPTIRQFIYGLKHGPLTSEKSS